MVGGSDKRQDTVVDYSVGIGYRTMAIDWPSIGRFVGSSSFSLGVTAGPTLHVSVGTGMLRQVAILFPDSATYGFDDIMIPRESYGNPVVLYDGEIPEHNSFGVSMRLGIAVEFGNPDPGLIIRPMLLYEQWLTTVTDADPRKISTLTARMNVLLRL